MPTYEYECRECNHQFEAFHWVEERLTPTKEKCKVCGSKEVGLGYVSSNGSAPAMTVDSNHRIDKPHNVGGFKETIQKICESPAVKKTKYEKILRDKHLS